MIIRDPWTFELALECDGCHDERVALPTGDIPIAADLARLTAFADGWVYERASYMERDFCSFCVWLSGDPLVSVEDQLAEWIGGGQ